MTDHDSIRDVRVLRFKYTRTGVGTPRGPSVVLREYTRHDQLRLLRRECEDSAASKDSRLSATFRKVRAETRRSCRVPLNAGVPSTVDLVSGPSGEEHT